MHSDMAIESSLSRLLLGHTKFAISGRVRMIEFNLKRGTE